MAEARRVLALFDEVRRSTPRPTGASEVEEARQLLDQVDERLRAARREQAHIPRVHLMAALQRDRDERLHCHLLRWLLDPLETHGYGSAFLEALLAECGVDVPAGADLLAAVAETEVSGQDSQIDVEVALPSAFLVHVEAKIGHYERQDQTSDEATDLARRCKAKRVAPDCAQPIYLTVGGTRPSARDEGLVRPWQAWSWGRMADVLRLPLRARAHEQTSLVEHVLDCFKMLTTGGSMEAFKPDEIDRLLIENWDKVTKLSQARTRLEERVRATFTQLAFEEALRGSPFAKWALAVESGRKYDGVYITPGNWPRDAQADTWTCFGFDGVTVEALFSDDPEEAPPVSFYWAPLLSRTQPPAGVIEEIRKLTSRQLPNGVELEAPKKWEPIRWRPRLELRSHPERIPELARLVVAEWERMAPIIPKIDELAKRAMKRSAR